MKKRIWTKLKEETGASLTFALLIFLVCAVVGSVVITAGTTAAGKFSKMTEMDRRYYNLASAVNLLSEELSSRTVTIIREKVTQETITTDYIVDTEDGISTTASDPESETNIIYRTYINPDEEMTPSYEREINPDDYRPNEGDTIARETLSFLTARAVQFLFGDRTCNTDEAMEYSVYNGVTEPETTFQLRHSIEAGSDKLNEDDLVINGTYELTSDGKIVFVLENGTDSNKYAMRLIMIPAIDETYSVKEDESGGETSIEYTETGYTETIQKEKTEQKISVITWNCGEREKITT